MVDDKEEDYFPFEFTNITVVNAPLLKDYYWGWFNLSYLNHHLLTAKDGLYNEFTVKVPPMPVNSLPIKIVLHMYNDSRSAKKWQFKRIKLCDCTIQSTQVGINSFKKKYNCPHRELLHISPTEGTVERREPFSTVLCIAYRLYGQTTLAYELTVDKRFKLRMNFQFNVHEFDPLSCVITKELFPVYIGSVQHLTQPIWIFNHYNQDMTFEFSTEEPGLQIVTKTLIARKYSLTPLLVKYRPSRVARVILKITMAFAEVETDFFISASGILYTIAIPVQQCPRNDIPSEDAPYVIFENYIGVKLQTTENSSVMVAVHNYSDKCVEFKWHTYQIPQYFAVNVVPEAFSCKPNHTALCLVNIKAEDMPCVFFRVPIACNVFEYSKQEGDEACEVDSQTSSSLDLIGSKLVTRLWVNMNFRIEGPPNIQIPAGKQINDIMAKCVYKIPPNFDQNILEKLFWSYMFGIKFLENAVNRKIEESSYSDLTSKGSSEEPFIDRNLTIGIMRLLLADAVTEISKRWRFVPREIAY